MATRFPLGFSSTGMCHCHFKQGKDGIVKLPEKWQKAVEQNCALPNKTLGENEKYVFYVYLKTKVTFGPIQYIQLLQFSNKTNNSNGKWEEHLNTVVHNIFGTRD